jgi:hypothetical protein
MVERVKDAPGAPKQASEETGQKASELLLALLEELRASRAEFKTLHELLEKVLAAQQRQDASSGYKEAEEVFTGEEAQGKAGQEGNMRSTVLRQAQRAPVPVAIQFIDTSQVFRSERSRNHDRAD